MKKLVMTLIAALLLAVPATASAASTAHGKVKLAIVQNSYYEAHHHGQGFVPSDWQVFHCTHAVTSTVRWNWAAWLYSGGRRARCLALFGSTLHSFPAGIEFMKIEHGYWQNVMGYWRGNPCFAPSKPGRPKVPWGVINDLLDGVNCPSAPGWGHPAE
jgi:hypothetical protein